MQTQAMLGQVLLGLINGAFYASLSLGLSVIFGLLNVVNFTHGAQYMMGAMVAWLLLTFVGVGYWPALILAPLIVGLSGLVLERIFLVRAYKLDHLYSLLLTVGLATVIEGLFLNIFGSSGHPYPAPDALRGGVDLGIMYLPLYRAWVVLASLLVCVGTWFVIEKTSLGAYLRAATENPNLVRAFGVKVPLLITLTYCGGVMLAAFTGVLAAPILQVSPLMGSHLIVVVFAVVVIGGMGSIGGSIITGFAVGLIEGLTKYFWPEAANTVPFVLMALVLIFRPLGLFGKSLIKHGATAMTAQLGRKVQLGAARSHLIVGGLLAGLVLIGPFIAYPTFLMKAMCFGLFAMSLNLLIGYAGLVSFGHAMFFGLAAYVTGYVVKAAGYPPEIGILCGVLVSAGLGLVSGLLAIRCKEIYFAMVTLAFSQMVYFFCLRAPFTGGEDGLQSVPRGVLFGFLNLESSTTLYYFVAAVFGLGIIAVHRTVHSPFGNVLRAIRDNEDRAISLGYNVRAYKLTAFVISAALAGLAGSVKVLVFQLASLTDVSAAASGEVLFMALLGGLGTLFGPVAGALVVTGMHEYLAPLGSWVLVIQGSVFVACVMLFRLGVVGEVSKRLKVSL